MYDIIDLLQSNGGFGHDHKVCSITKRNAGLLLSNLQTKFRSADRQIIIVWPSDDTSTK